jgi:hypothetical protein
MLFGTSGSNFTHCVQDSAPLKTSKKSEKKSFQKKKQRLTEWRAQGGGVHIDAPQINRSFFFFFFFFETD